MRKYVAPTAKVAPLERQALSRHGGHRAARRAGSGNDSAVFTIYYADPNAPGNDGKNPKEMNYKSFTKVIVNNGTGSLVKVTGLDPNFYYRIKKNVWAWGYDQLTPQAYTSEVTKNPIVFENKAKETDYKHAEATVQNRTGAGQKRRINGRSPR